MNSPISLIQSLLIKLSVFSIGVALILWFGWSVPQANPMKSFSSFSSSLDMNQGTKEEFQSLPGIGPVLASRIIDHRKSIEVFADIEDLKAIEGIGDKKLAQLRPYLTINQPAKVESQK